MIYCFCCYIIKSAGETAKKVFVISHLKSTAYRNKISLKLGYRTVNARKYVRCARTFHLKSVKTFWRRTFTSVLCTSLCNFSFVLATHSTFCWECFMRQGFLTCSQISGYFPTHLVIGSSSPRSQNVLALIPQRDVTNLSTMDICKDSCLKIPLKISVLLCPVNVNITNPFYVCLGFDYCI